MRNFNAILACRALAVVFLGGVFSAPSLVLAQSEPDRLLRLNGGFGNANYYFCFAQSREAAYGVQVFTEVVSTDARVTLYQMLEGTDAATNPLPGRPWRDVRCFEDRGGGSGTFNTREDAESSRKQFMDASREIGMTIVEIPWPGKLGDRDGAQSPSKKARRGTEPTSEAKQAGETAKTDVSASPPKYIEVAGPDGPMRLSPEVAARNQAAAEEYRRKIEAHARERADHDRKMAEYQESIARAGRTLRDHEAQLRAQQEEHQKQLREHAARVNERASDTPCARYRAAKGVGWKVNPCV